MNILPKKRWHVRTKDNIARVRRDEAAAREEEEKRQQKLELAESEARINFLRKKSGLPERHTNANAEESTTTEATTVNDSDTSKHVDLFADYKSHTKATNKDLEKEKKEEREKYEKQIGYLTYLGQDTNEALKLRSWYEVAPKRAEVGDATVVEKDMKNKHTQDPLTLINALLPPEKTDKNKIKRPTSLKRPREEEACVEDEVKRSKLIEQAPKQKKKDKSEKKKHKKEKHKRREKKHKNKKDKYRLKAEKEAEEEERKRDKLAQLRRERLHREAIEKARQEALLAPKEPAVANDKNKSAAPTPRIVQKYNSQFNPELAKQNMI